MTEKTMKQVAAKAAAVMQTRGWCSGMRQDSIGQVCVLGALNIALGVQPNDYHVDKKRDLLAFLVAQLNLKPESVTDRPTLLLARWSNATNQATVVNGLRKVAQR